MDKPKLGQRISATDRLVRCETGKKGYELGWMRSIDQYNWRKNPEPVEGIFVGSRTYTTGVGHWNGEYNEWEVLERYPVWLIVNHARHNPIPVFPEDCSF